MIRTFLIVAISFLFYLTVLAGQPDSLTVSDGQNELTIYVIPSKVKYDWTSPRTLLKSYIKNYWRNLCRKDAYTLGHAFLELKTGENEESILTGVRAAPGSDMRKMVLKEHYGLSILGTDVEGIFEKKEVLEQKIKKFSRKDRLAFFTVEVSDEAAERMITFYKEYHEKNSNNGHSILRYGGAFYPRYEGEGSGCSAYAVSFLDLAGLLQEEFDSWMIEMDIPLDLMGGPYNNYNEVRIKDIKKREHWASTDGSDSTGYEHLELFDPTLIYEWIINLRDSQPTDFKYDVEPVEYNDAPGIKIDGSNVPAPIEESIFLERENSSLFLDYYHEEKASEN
jgi:hypothetical protein